MAGAAPPASGPTHASPALAPPWAAPVALAALAVAALLTGLVWHTTRLDPVDAWVMRGQELASAHADGLARLVSSTLPVGLTVTTMVGGAALAGLAGRRDAVVHALTGVPATLAAELVLKRLVHRQWNGDPALVFPSGHIAIATAAAMVTVLVVRVVPALQPACVATAFVAGGIVLVVAVARLVETVHSLTDVVGGSATGLVVTLAEALAITARCQRTRLRAG